MAARSSAPRRSRRQRPLDLSTARLMLVFSDTPDEAVAAFAAKFPGGTVDLTGREASGRQVEVLAFGEPS